MSRRILAYAIVCLTGYGSVQWARADRIPAESTASAERPVIALLPAGRLKGQYLIDAYAYGAADLRSYQVTVKTSGGTSGELTLSGVIINRQRADFVFGGASAVTAESVISSRLAAVAFDSGVAVSDWAYLGTYVFRPTADAQGDFQVSIGAGKETLLADSSNVTIPFVAGPDARIRVDRRPALRAPTKESGTK